MSRKAEKGFAAMYSSTLKVFLNMHACTHTHFCTYSMHMWGLLSAVIRTATAAVSMMASCKRKHSASFGWPYTVTVECNFCHTCGDPAVSTAIWSWFIKFKESGHVEKHESPGWS